MKVFDIVTLLATGLVAIYLIWRFVQHLRRGSGPKRPDIYYIIAFAVLLVAGLILIIASYGALQSPLVIIVAVLIPAGLAVGLIAQFYPGWEKGYLTFAIIGFLAIAITRFTGPPLVATIVLALVHAIFGLTIFIVPIRAVTAAKAPAGFIGVTVGGALIGLGGIALAFLKTGGQLLFFSTDFVLLILAPLLLCMALAFAFGFVKKVRKDLVSG